MNKTAPLLLAATIGLTTAVADETRNFGLELLQQTAKAQQGNICISPYSAAGTLRLLEPGAAHETLAQIKTLLSGTSGLQTLAEKTTLSLETANRIYVDSQLPLNAAYKAAVPKGAATSIDFQNNPGAARATIHQWISQVTHQRIENILPSGSIVQNTRLVAVNAVCFKNKWEMEFLADNTKPEAFTLTDGTVKQVPMMHHSFRFPCSKTEAYSAIELPYRPDDKALENRTKAKKPWTEGSMIAILPPEGVPVDEFVRKLDAAKLAEIRLDLDKSRTGKNKPVVALSLPKFKYTMDIDMQQTLIALGMKDAFTPNADFSGIASDKTPLQLSAVYQKCLISVDEEGTEAAAATAAVAFWEGGPVEMKTDHPLVLRFDRPFVWIVVADRDAPSSTPLFMGIVREP